MNTDKHFVFNPCSSVANLPFWLFQHGPYYDAVLAVASEPRLMCR
jgi:hypothetical protein